MMMLALYEFFIGPGLAVSLAVFGLGFTVRGIHYVRGLGWRQDRLSYRSMPTQAACGAAWSLCAWLLPFGSRSSREHPWLTLASVTFHGSMALLVFAQPGHAALRRVHSGEAWFALPQTASDCLTVVAIAALTVLAGRRLLSPVLRFLTTWRDWLLIGLCALMLGSGLLASLDSGGRFLEQLPQVSPWLVAHMGVSELFLVLAPFTFLAHMVFFFLSRIQIGIDFAVKRGGRKRGASFPW